MRRIATLHALPALAVTAASLAIPFLSQDGARYSAADTSAVTVKAKAAAVAPDQQFPVGSPAIAKAKEVATGVWGRDACGGNVQMVWTVLEPGTNATASWRNPSDAWNNAAENFDCKIDINTQAAYDFPKLCTVLVHELGHLNGQQHTPQAGQLMSAFYTDPIAQCVAADPNPPAPEPAEVEDEVAVPPTTQTASTSKAKTKKQPLRETKRTASTAKRKTVKRCVVRFKAGKKVKRCTTVKADTKRSKSAAAKRRKRS
ncbi:MAG TPA: hypothetical protein VN238_03310 [Solirubrobacteraceae bacterium]|nr:hypothetical protein [Solirubrobacteraceae bacterium]